MIYKDDNKGNFEVYGLVHKIHFMRKSGLKVEIDINIKSPI